MTFPAISATVLVGGLGGFVVGDVLTALGGSYTTVGGVSQFAQFTVATVDGSGNVLTVTVGPQGGDYLAPPINPVTCRGGSGISPVVLTVVWSSTAGIFPSLPGLAWSVIKSPTYQTRIQRSISGRELRALDYPFPLWQFTLIFDFLRQNLLAGFNELKTLMGFYMVAQGAYGSFLFNDVTDNSVTGQLLPYAVSFINTIPSISSAGTGYAVNNIVSLSGGGVSFVGGAQTSWSVASVGGSGNITSLNLVNPGSYHYVMATGVTPVNLVGGSGSGAAVNNLPWVTQVQLARTLGDPTISGGGFTEPIIAPNVVSNIYYSGVAQSNYSINYATGVVTLAAPFTAIQPPISVDMTYYFRCRFVDDRYDFENFMLNLWNMKKLTFISVRP